MRKQQKSDISPACRLARRAAHTIPADHKNWISFLVASARGTKVFLVGARLIRYLRRFRLVTTSLRLFPWILLLINTNTLLYALAGILVMLLPLFLVGALSLITSASIRYRKLNRRMAKDLVGHDVYVFFPTRRGEFSHGRFWRGNILDMASKSLGTIFIVSPFFISSKGFTSVQCPV